MPKPGRLTVVAPGSGEISASAAARQMHLSAQAVGIWCAKPGAPVRREGARVIVQWPELMRWRERELCRQAVDEALRKVKPAVGDGHWADRKGEADARRAELDVARMESSMVLVDEAASVTERIFADLRAKLMPFARTVSPTLLGAKTIVEMEQRLHPAIARLMRTLSAVGEPVDEAA